LESELHAVGLNVRVIPLVQSAITPFFTENTYPCLFAQWQGVANPVEAYRGILQSSSAVNPGHTNYVDQYIEQLLGSFNAQSEQPIFDAINRTMKSNPGYAPLYGIPLVNVYSSNVAGWKVSPYQEDNWQGLYFKG
jgi:hypothetical protein